MVHEAEGLRASERSVYLPLFVSIYLLISSPLFHPCSRTTSLTLSPPISSMAATNPETQLPLPPASSSAPSPEPSSTPAIPPKHRAKPRGTTFWSSEQLAFLEAHIGPLEALLIKHNLHVGKSGKQHDPPEIRGFVDSVAASALEHAAFANLDKEQKSDENYKKVVSIIQQFARLLMRISGYSDLVSQSKEPTDRSQVHKGCCRGVQG